MYYFLGTLVVVLMTSCLSHAQFSDEPMLNIVSLVVNTTENEAGTGNGEEEVPVTPPPGSETCKQKTDIILAVDMSGSVNDAGAVDLVKKSASDMIKLLPVEEKAAEPIYRVGVLMYSGEQDTRVIFDLRDLTSASLPEMTKLIMDAKIHHGQTHTDKALQRVREKMFSKARTGAKKVLVIVADGEIWNKNNWLANTRKEEEDAQKLNQAALKVEIDALDTEGVLRIGVGVGGKLDQFRDQLESMVSDPKDEHYFEVKKWPSFETYFPGLVSSKVTCPDISMVDIVKHVNEKLNNNNNNINNNNNNSTSSITPAPEVNEGTSKEGLVEIGDVSLLAKK